MRSGGTSGRGFGNSDDATRWILCRLAMRRKPACQGTTHAGKENRTRDILHRPLIRRPSYWRLDSVRGERLQKRKEVRGWTSGDFVEVAGPERTPVSRDLDQER